MSVASLFELVVWVQMIASMCFCLYAFFASGDGINWFSFRHNPVLITSAVGCLAAFFSGFPPPTSAFFITGLAWGAYAALVTRQSWPFRLWKSHIIPVNLPLAVIALLLLYPYY